MTGGYLTQYIDTQASVPMAPEESLHIPRSERSRKVLVTGASGFLGGSLIRRLLDQGAEVTGLCRRPQPELEAAGVTILSIDLANSKAVRNACRGMDTVFHTAAKVGIWGRYQDFHDANVVGTQSIINGCRDFEVEKLVYTSTPSVVFNGEDHSGANESTPLGKKIPCHYPTTKAIAESAVRAANGEPPGNLKTVSLRPHLIWGPGDPNLIPRVLERGRKGRLRIVGDGVNRVDLSYIDNVVDAHLHAESALDNEAHNPGGNAYFISNDEPVALWPWINELLENNGIPPIEKRISLSKARRLGASLEFIWRLFRIGSEPPMTRFVASELAKDHWFDISAAKRDLNFQPNVSMEEGMKRLLQYSSTASSNT